MRVSAPIANIRATLNATLRASTTTLALIGLAGCLDLKTTADACTISVAPASLTLPVNGASTIVGTAFDCKGNSIRNKKISYSSSNTAVATVTTEGNVIAVGVGGASVSAVADGKSASVQVTVTPEAAATVTVTPSTLTLRRTNTRQLTATARNNQNTVITGRTFRWGSSNSSIVSVDQNGLLTALTPGTVVISAEADQTSGNATVTVTEIPIGSCSLAPATSKLTVSQSVQPAITLRDTANNVISSLGRSIAWTSDNEIAATVTGSGLVTARKAGTARITASPVENTQASCNASVEVVDARIVSAVIAPKPATLRLGVARQFGVTLTDSAGGAIPAGRTITWRSVTPATVTVSANGLVTGLALGAARIAVNAEGAVDTVNFTISKIPVATVRLSPLSSSIVQGGTIQLSATIEDSTGTAVTDRVVEWTSSDPTRASVSQSGLVTTTAPGTVTITAISETRSGTASVTVQPIPVDTIVASDYTVALNATSKTFSIQLRDVNGNQLFSRSVAITSSQPDVATGTANSNATQVTVSASKAGTTILTMRALNSNGQPEGRVTNVTVTITAATP
ncbi:Ig-like domain-containing protein [Gemmatimonas sp.]|uniref:Ig-like domain-containing protein n=1 Tax=Gemmatimonas sp. TaxID=1962908 RepID=UPI00286C3DBD|nr:Ig-like domain-containing protein [Gemmatimonas sp.]